MIDYILDFFITNKIVGFFITLASFGALFRLLWEILKLIWNFFKPCKKAKKIATLINKEYIQLSKKAGDKKNAYHTNAANIEFAASKYPIKRDLEDSVFNSIQNLKPIKKQKSIDLLVIEGMQGAGKSNFILQIAIILAKQKKSVYQLKNSAYTTKDIQELAEVKKQPYLIIDNIFRIEKIVEFLEAQTDMNCVILATSPSHEVKKIEFKNKNEHGLHKINVEGVSEDSWPILESFSNNELQVLKKSFPDIDNTLWEQLTKESKEPIVLLNRIVKGGNTFYSFIKIIEKEAERLEKNIPLAYNAYCIICAFFRVGAIAIPSSILQYLLIKIGESKMQIETFLTDLKKDYKNNTNNSQAKGKIHFIEQSEYQEICWCPESERHAQALALSEKHRTFLRQFSDKLIEHLDNKNPIHRLFVARFFASILQQNFSKKDLEQDNHTLELIKIKKNLIGYVIKSFSFLDDFLSANTTHQILLVSVLRKIKDNLPLLREEFDVNYIDTYTNNFNRVELKYIGEVKEISSDIEALSIIHWKIAQEKKVFHTDVERYNDSNIMLELKKWVDRKETPFYLKKDYLTFIEEWGTEEQKRENTNIIKKWSKESKYWDSSRYWRHYYRDIFDNKINKKKMIFKKRKEAGKSIEETPYDITLRKLSFYSDIILSDNYQEKKNILSELAEFLDDEKVYKKSKFGEIFDFYLQSVSWGSKKQKKDAIERAKNWLKKNPCYSSYIQKIRRIFLYLVLDWGTLDEKEEVYEETSRWLEKYPSSFEVRMAWIYLGSWMNSESKTKKLLEVKSFLDNEKNIKIKEKIYVAYLYLASRSKKKEYEKAFEYVTTNHSEAFKIRSGYIRTSQALLIHYIGRYQDKVRCLPLIEKSFQRNPNNFRLRVVYLLLLASFKKRNILSKIKTEEALAKCREWSQESWVSSDFWFAYLRLHDTFGMISEKTMEIVGKWIEKNPEYMHTNVRQYYEYCTHNLNNQNPTK